MDDYLIQHFATEEQAMAENSYPFLEFQIGLHRLFIKYFENFKKELAKNLSTHRVYLLFRAQILLVDWLVNHTSELDKHFGKFLQRKNSGKPF